MPPSKHATDLRATAAPARRAKRRARPPVELNVAHVQHIGDRTDQQDAVGSWRLLRPVADPQPERRLLVVADGMGGMADGRLAADTAVRRLPDHVRAAWNPEMPRSTQLMDAFTDTHNDVREALRGQNGGCAVTACYVRGGPGGLAAFAWAGDVLGALLRLRGGRYVVEWHSTPHRAGRHMLTNCMGTRHDCDAEVTPDLALRPDDLLVLASDGVSDSVSLNDVCAMAGPDTRRFAALLLQRALAAGKVGERDNATVLVAHVPPAFLLAPGER